MKLFGDKSKEIKEFHEEKADDFKPPKAPMKLPDIKKPLPPPAPASRHAFRPPASRESSDSPPLFIKVDKYREIVKNIRDLKSNIMNMRDALDVLAEMQKEVANGIEIAHKTIDGLNGVIANLDSYFLRPQGIQHHMEDDVGPGAVDEGEIENQMKDVYGQVEKLRAQLRSIK